MELNRALGESSTDGRPVPLEFSFPDYATALEFATVYYGDPQEAKEHLDRELEAH